MISCHGPLRAEVTSFQVESVPRLARCQWISESFTNMYAAWPSSLGVFYIYDMITRADVGFMNFITFYFLLLMFFAAVSDRLHSVTYSAVTAHTAFLLCQCFLDSIQFPDNIRIKLQRVQLL